MTVNDGLTQLILDDRIRGRSYAEIELKHGIPAIEAMAMVREALESTTMRDPIEMRGIVMLRTEKIIEHLWAGLEAGSFKHGEAIIKALERLSELLDLNQETIRHEFTVISDEETLQLFAVMKLAFAQLQQKVNALPLTDAAVQALEAWPEWVAESSTAAVEQVLYLDESDNTFK
jgi:hypothetical protein